MTTIKFGTDGWRGVIAEDFTFCNVRRVCQAIADYINSQQSTVNSQRIIVGYDRRFLSEEYAKIACEVLAANNIKVFFTGKPTTTPAVTLAIKMRNLSGAIVITASHNPPRFNGIKFKTKEATSADETVTKIIEKLIIKAKPKSIDFNRALSKNLIKMIDIDKDYINFIRNYIDMNIIKKTRPNLLIDYMHGAGAGYIEKLLKSSGCKITAMRTEKDPLFGGVSPEPVPKHLKDFLNRAKVEKPNLAIALDGDADRIAACGAEGEYLCSGQIISLILLHLVEYRKLKGAVIKTISGTDLIEKIAKDFKLELLETPVGFKHISQIMLRRDVLIGGEESGGIGFKGYIPERDGIISGLFLLEMVSARRKSIDKIMDDVNKRYGNFYYNRFDLDLSVKRGMKVVSKLKESPPRKLLGKEILEIKTYDGIKFILKEGNWLLIRSSGTEPILRVYAESSTKSDLKALLDAGRRLVTKWS